MNRCKPTLQAIDAFKHQQFWHAWGSISSSACDDCKKASPQITTSSKSLAPSSSYFAAATDLSACLHANDLSAPPVLFPTCSGPVWGPMAYAWGHKLGQVQKGLYWAIRQQNGVLGARAARAKWEEAIRNEIWALAKAIRRPITMPLDGAQRRLFQGLNCIPPGPNHHTHLSSRSHHLTAASSHIRQKA